MKKLKIARIWILLLISILANYSSFSQITFDPPVGTVIVDANCVATFDLNTTIGNFGADMPTITSDAGNTIVNVALINATAFPMVDTDPVFFGQQTSFTLSDGSVYSLTTRFRIEDDQGNVFTETYFFVIEDNIAPAISNAPADITISCIDDLPNATDEQYADGSPVLVDDNCDTYLYYTFTEANSFPQMCVGGTITRTWEVSDFSFNSNSVSQNITISPVTPTINTQASDLTFACDGVTTVDGAFGIWLTLHGRAKASFNCGDQDHLLSWESYEAGTLNPAVLPTIGCITDIDYSVDFVVSDDCGNTETTTASFKVSDDQAPEIILCTPDTTAYTSVNGLGDCVANVTLPSPVIKDDCILTTSPNVGFTLEFSDDGGATYAIVTYPNDVVKDFSEGTHNIVFRVTDCTGNSSLCSYTLTIEDDEVPSYNVCPLDALNNQYDSPMCQPILVTFPKPTDLADNCSSNFKTYILVEGATEIDKMAFPDADPDVAISLNYGVNTITYIIEDEAGNENTASCTKDITISNPNLITPVIQTPITQPVCIGESINLIDNASVSIYWNWYEDLAPFGVVGDEDVPIDLTVVNNINIPARGTAFNVYVIGSDRFCQTPPSNIVTINAAVAATKPVISANKSVYCSSDEITLSIDNDDASWSAFLWSGPNGYSSNLEVPANITNISSNESGAYILEVQNTVLGCTLKDTVEIDVKDGGDASITVGNYSPNGGCVDGSGNLDFVLSETPIDQGNYTYSWTGPNTFTSSDKEPTIQNVSINENGSYFVTIFDEDGCEGNTEEIVVALKAIPNTPVISIQNTTLCEGQVLRVEVGSYAGTNVEYRWTTPYNTALITTDAFTQVDSVLSMHEGQYSLVVSVDGCLSEPSNVLATTIKTTPEKPEIIADSDLCSNEKLVLETNEFAGATYNWSSTNFTASGISVEVNTPETGDYYLQLELDGCLSIMDTHTVLIHLDPVAINLIEKEGDICLDNENMEIVLFADENNNSSTLHWVNFEGDTLQSSNLDSLIISDISNFPSGTYSFACYKEGEFCNSPMSNYIEVNTMKAPDEVALAGDDLKVCDQLTANLDATNPIGEGSWTQLSGTAVTIDDITNNLANISGLENGNEYSFEWSLSSGVCGVYSRDTVHVFVDEASQVANAGDDIEKCNSSSITLGGNAVGSNSLGTWTQPSGQQATIADANNPVSEISGLNTGEDYVFTWEISNPGCGVYSESTVNVNIFESETANAGNSENLCSSTTVTAESTTCAGVWSSDDTAIEFVDAHSNTTEVNNLSNGMNTLIWTLDCGECGNSADTIHLYYEPDFIINPDTMEVSFAGEGMINILQNDVLYGDGSYSITNQPDNGSIEDLGDGLIQYTHTKLRGNSDSFTYEFCSEVCANNCYTATVFINVNSIDNCKIPSIFTPNGDNYNDLFIIPCLENNQYSSCKVIIFNQYGDEVFSASPYNNDWDGTYNNKPLPVSTYFYSVDFGDSKDPQAGYLIIER